MSQANGKLAVIEKKYLHKNDLALFRPGDTVRVHVKIKEGDKERIQAYEGTVIAMNNTGSRKTFTVRKVSHGVGVERVFPVFSPNVTKVEKVESAHVRRAKLYYVRNLIGKAARIRGENEVQ